MFQDESNLRPSPCHTVVTHSFLQPSFCTTSDHSQIPKSTAIAESHSFARLPRFDTAHMQNSCILEKGLHCCGFFTKLLGRSCNVTFAVTSLTIPSFQKTSPQTSLSSFSKTQVAGLSCACISHPPWVKTKRKRSPSLPSHLCTGSLPASSPVTAKWHSAASWCAHSETAILHPWELELNERAKTKAESPRTMVHTGLGVFFHVPPRLKMLCCKQRLKNCVLLLKSANFSSWTREMKGITQFLERESKKEFQCPREQC